MLFCFIVSFFQCIDAIILMRIDTMPSLNGALVGLALGLHKSS